MDPSPNHRHMLREYLLGRLNAPSEERQRALAESYFEDDGRYEELTAVEDELLDLYVCGRLSPEDRVGFASYLAHLPKELAREKLAFVQALAQTAAKQATQQTEKDLLGAATAMTSAATSEPSAGQHLFGPTLPQPLVWRYSFAAAMLLLGITLAWLLFYNYRLQQSNKLLQAGLDQSARERQESQQSLQDLQQQSADQIREKEQLQAELKRVREQSESQSQQLARLQSDSLPSSPMLRGNDERRTVPGPNDKGSPSGNQITVKSGMQSIRLNLQIPRGETYQMIEARLTETNTNKVVWKSVCEPACAPTIVNNSLVLQLPAGYLTTGQHRLNLRLRAADGLIVPKEYDFTIVKQ